MTKEELKQKAEEISKIVYGYINNDYVLGYCDGAESDKKLIEEHEKQPITKTFVKPTYAEKKRVDVKMNKEELEKEAREYLAEHSEYSEVFGQTYVAVDTLTAMVDFAEPREKQIAVLSKRCLQLQQDKGELIDETRKLEAQIEKQKDQLTKAKELLKRWANSYGSIDVALCKQTDRFLSEVEK